MGVSPEGPRKRKALAPISWKKMFLLKRTLIVSFEVVKNEIGVFWIHLACKNLDVRVSEQFLTCKKIEFVSKGHWKGQQKLLTSKKLSLHVFEVFLHIFLFLNSSRGFY